MLDPHPDLQGGFTVIELLMVVVIIGVLAGIGIPSMLNQTDPQDGSYKVAIVNWAIPQDTAGVRAYLGVVDTVAMQSGVGSVVSILCEQQQTGTVNFSGYSSGNNYAVVTNSVDPTTFPACAAPFEGFR